MGFAPKFITRSSCRLRWALRALKLPVVRVEDDASLTPVSEHEDIAAAVAAGKYQVEVEDFSYGLSVDGGRAACFAEDG